MLGDLGWEKGAVIYTLSSQRRSQVIALEDRVSDLLVFTMLSEVSELALWPWHGVSSCTAAVWSHSRLPGNLVGHGKTLSMHLGEE